MLVLRCTQKLLARLKQADNLPAVESTTRLGDWYGNILQTRSSSAPALHQRTVPTSGGDSHSRRQAVGVGVSGRRVRSVGPCRRRRRGHRRRAVADVGDCVRPDQESQPARHLERLRVHGAGRECAAARTRDARGADAVPGADADSPAGRRESDRVDASCVPRQVAGAGFRVAPVLRLSGSAWARQDCPSALRGLDPPGALP